jgi:hypothetical protein
MKMRRSYLRGMSDGASPKGIPVLQPPALRIWPLLPVSAYEVKPAFNFDETLIHPAMAAAPLPRIDVETSALHRADDHERLSLERGKPETKPSKEIPENTGERGLFHLSAASSEPSWKSPSVRENEPRRREEFDVEHLAPAEAPLQRTEPISARKSRSELKKHEESPLDVLAPAGFYFKQTEGVSTQENPLKLQRESATASPVWESAGVENKGPKSGLRQELKPPEEGSRTGGRQPDRRLEPHNSTAHNERQPKQRVEARLEAADQPKPVPRTPVRKLTPEERSSGNKKAAYAPSYKETHEQRGPRNSIRIGTIEIHVAPAPPAPAPRPVVRQTPASPVPLLTRGFTSQFGFRQG